MQYVRMKDLVNAYTPLEANYSFQFMKLLTKHGYVNFANYDFAVDLFIFARQCGHDVVFVEWHDVNTLDGSTVSTYTIVKRKLRMRKPERPQSPRLWKDVYDIPDEDVERIADEIMGNRA